MLMHFDNVGMASDAEVTELLDGAGRSGPVDLNKFRGGLAASLDMSANARQSASIIHAMRNSRSRRCAAS
jgi:hypothetical protein